MVIFQGMMVMFLKLSQKIYMEKLLVELHLKFILINMKNLIDSSQVIRIILLINKNYLKDQLKVLGVWNKLWKLKIILETKFLEKQFLMRKKKIVKNLLIKQYQVIKVI